MLPEQKEFTKKDLKKLKSTGMATGKIKRISGRINAVNNPVSVERLSELQSYQKILEIQKYTKETLLPLKEQAITVIAKIRKAFGAVKNQREHLNKTESQETSVNYKKHAAYILPASLVDFEGESSFIFDYVTTRKALRDATHEFGRLCKELKELRMSEANHMRTGMLSPSEFSMQNRFLDVQLNPNGTVNAATAVCKELDAVCDELIPGFFGSSDTSPTIFDMQEKMKKTAWGIALDNKEKIEKIEAIQSTKKVEKLKTTEQEKQDLEKKNKELQLLKRETRSVIEEASNLAAGKSNAVTFQVAPELAQSTSENSVSLLLSSLQEKILTTVMQIKKFSSNSSKNNREIFNKIFNIDTQEQKTIVEESHYEFLKISYELNQKYYLFLKEKFAGLKLSEASQFFIILSDLEKIEKARLETAKQFLEQYHIKDVTFLTKLLVPVHRAMVRFKKEYLEPIVKLAIIDKQARLGAQLEAAKIKLKQVKLNGEFLGERSYEDIEKQILSYDKRLEKVLQEQKTPTQYIEEILAIEKEMKAIILVPALYIHTEMVTQQKMLLQQQQEKEREQKNNADLFTIENFKEEKLPLLRQKLVLDVLERLFSHPANVTFVEIQNMLFILRGEERSVESVQGHYLFQFPCLWEGYETAPQVLVAPFHKAGAPMQAKIEDDNIIGKLRSACAAAGIENLELLRKIAKKSAKMWCSAANPGLV